MAHERLQAVREQIVAWCAGRSWTWRAPLLAWLAWSGLWSLRDPFRPDLFGALNLGIHEGGHLLFSWLPGEWLMVAGGTLLQLAAPAASAVMFLRQPDYFAVTVCGAWLASGLRDVSVYVADARAMDLPLVTVGDGEAVHDWNYLLGSLGLLGADAVLSGLVWALAFVCLWGSIAAGGWMLFRMARPAPVVE